jgi:hypothetical protein
MKRFIKSKKGIALLATLVVAAAAAIGAYAYFTSTGTGTGSATVGSASNWVVGETSHTGGPLYPDPAPGGTNIVTENYSINNPGAGNQNLNSLTISVANSDGTTWKLCAGETPSTSTFDVSGNCTNGNFVGEAPCTKADISLGGNSAGSDYSDTTDLGDYTAGQTGSNNIAVELIDNGNPQDNCQGATVPLYYSAN